MSAEKVLGIIREQGIGRTPKTTETLESLGFDEPDYIALATDLANNFDITFKQEDLRPKMTVGQVIDLVKKRQG